MRGFARHRLVADLFAEPGRHDLTDTVNFTAIRRAAEGAGFRFAGAGTQRDVLLALGIRLVCCVRCSGGDGVAHGTGNLRGVLFTTAAN